MPGAAYTRSAFLPSLFQRWDSALFIMATAGLLAVQSSATQADERPAAEVSKPRVTACSSRYELVADPAPPTGETDGKQALRDGYGTYDDWGSENVTVLSSHQTGLNETGLRVDYPEGTSSPGDNGQGGVGFFATIDGLARQERGCMQYKVRFEPGFDFVKGGKLPGFYGGKAPSGGEEVSGDEGFSMRFMWRENGQGELYEYVAETGKKYGLSVGRGSWSFPTGEWVTIEQEIILNDPRRSNGIARVWINGEPVLEHSNIVYRTHDHIYVDGLMFSTFFGGHGKDWRTPRDQQADFADFRFFRSHR